jgi:hypothetical protein
MTLPHRSSPPFATSSRVHRGLPWAYLALLLCTLLALGATALRIAVTLPLRDEVGYTDTFMVYDAQHYGTTGHLYRGPDEAPYNPSPYSPMFYWVASIPYRLAQPANPFLPGRLIAEAFFVLSVLVTVSIARSLTRHRSVVAWSALLGFSVYLFGEWAPQVRSDFMGCLFALLALRLLMSRWRHAAALAGLAAGLAFAFKILFVSAAAAGFLWLLGRRRYRHAAVFAAGALVMAAGGYLVFVPFEPHMLENITAIRSSIVNYRGWPHVLYAVGREPVFLLAASVVPLFLRRSGWPRRRLGPKSGLLLLYGAISLVVGSIAMLHPGSNINYLFETLLVAVPLASIAPPRLYRLRGRAPVLEVLLAGLILAVQLPTTLDSVKRSVTWNVRARNAEWDLFKELLKDRKVFTAGTPFALLVPSPPISEPYLIRLLEMQGRYDPAPLADRLRAGEYDLVVTRLSNSEVYRGVGYLSPAFRNAIRAAYTPHCALAGRIFHLPKDERDVAPLKDGLGRLGCTPMRDVLDGLLVSW